jgi:hypothetical protein
MDSKIVLKLQNLQSIFVSVYKHYDGFAMHMCGSNVKWSPGFLQWGFLAEY